MALSMLTLEISWSAGLKRDGLRTLRALLRYCREHPSRLADPGIAEDLQAFESILLEAEAKGVRWHLGQYS